MFVTVALADMTAYICNYGAGTFVTDHTATHTTSASSAVTTQCKTVNNVQHLNTVSITSSN